jgi:hypothetical protein
MAANSHGFHEKPPISTVVGGGPFISIPENPFITNKGWGTCMEQKKCSM